MTLTSTEKRVILAGICAALLYLAWSSGNIQIASSVLLFNIPFRAHT